MAALAAVLTTHQQRLRDAFWHLAHEAGPGYRAIPMEQLQAGFYASADALVAAVVAQDPDIMYRRWLEISQIRAEQGVPAEEVLAVAGFLRRVTLELLEDVYAGDPAGELAALRLVENILQCSRDGVTHGFERYSRSVRSRLERQRDELESVMDELSAPIVPVHERILVMPLIGSVDSRRASVVLETMLEQVARSGAQVVILDITGVPLVDTQVANYLIQMTRAVGLLGAEVLLVGVAPSIAQTIVQLGVDLSSITTCANLAVGLDHALRRLGLAIQPLPARRPTETALAGAPRTAVATA